MTNIMESQNFNSDLGRSELPVGGVTVSKILSPKVTANHLKVGV